MKMAWMAGALAATLWGGAAFAETQSSVDTQQQEQPSQPTTSQSQQDSWRQSTAPDDNTVKGGTEQNAPQDQTTGTGGSASAGIGGAGVAGTAQVQGNAPAPVQMSNGHYQIQANLPDRGQTLLDCVPAQQNAQLDKDHVLIQQNLASGTGWFDCTPSNTNVKPMLGTGGAGETNVVEVQREETKSNALSGTTVLLGGGVEGYTGSLASRIAPGPSYGVAIDFRPSDVFGLELAYSGAANELKSKVTNGVNASSGPDVLRNGGRMLLSLGLAATPVQPYLTAGVGINRYDFRGASALYWFKDDTAGEVPLGLGFRAQSGAFTADLRGLYMVPFEQDIEPGIASSASINTTNGSVHTGNAGRYQGELRIGATW